MMNRACIPIFLCVSMLISGCIPKPEIPQHVPAKHQGTVLSPPQPVSTANFVSLEIETHSGWGYESDIVVKDGLLKTLGHDAGKTNKRVLKSVSLTQAELDAIISALNTTNFPVLVGNYRQSGLYDATSTTVTLTLKQGDKQKAYRVSNYGALAPKAFYTALEAIHRVLDRRLPSH